MKIFIKSIVIAIGIVKLTILPAWAGSVPSLIDFEAGTPAVADDVDKNFTDIKNAVDDNDSRITTLQNSSWELSGTDLFYDNGNVGIGMISPAAKLNVVSTSDTNFVEALRLENSGNTGGSATGILFKAGGASDGYKAGIAFQKLDTVGRGSLFILQDNTADNSSPTIDDAVVTIDKIGNVGIGIADPDTQLHIVHTFGILDNGLSIEGGGSDAWSLYTASTNELWLNYRPNSSSNFSRKGTFNPTTGVYSPVSDKRLKKNIEPLGKVLEKIKGLKPRKYHFKANKDTDPKYFGLIGQELHSILPEVVNINNGEDGNIGGIHTISYTALIPVLIKGMQELQEIIEGQQADIEKLKEEVKAQKEIKNVALRKEINDIKTENKIFKSENEQLRETIATLVARQETIDAMLLAVSTNLTKEKLVKLGRLNLDEVQKSVQ